MIALVPVAVVMAARPKATALLAQLHFVLATSAGADGDERARGGSVGKAYPSPVRYSGILRRWGSISAFTDQFRKAMRSAPTRRLLPSSCVPQFHT